MGPTVASSCLALALSACAHDPIVVARDPPVRPMRELPPGPGRVELVFQTEGEAFTTIQRLMHEAGFRDALMVRPTFTDAALVPMARGAQVYLRRFLTDAAAARAHYGEVTALFLGAPRALDDWGDAEVLEAYQAFHAAGIAHELVHAVRALTGAFDEQDVAAEERLARDVEGPVLARLVALGRVPASWLASYDRMLARFLADLERAPRTSLPADPVARERLIGAGYARATAPVAGDPDMLAAVHALVTYSRERLRGTIPALASLSDHAGDRVTAAWRNGLAELARDHLPALGLTVAPRAREDDVWLVHATRAGVAAHLVLQREEERVVISLRSPCVIPKARRAAALEVLAAANLAYGEGVVGHDGGVVFQETIHALSLSSDPTRWVDKLLVDWQRFERATRALTGVVTGALPLERALALARGKAP